MATLSVPTRQTSDGMAGEIVVPITAAAQSPLALLESAVKSGAAPDTIKTLMDFATQWKAQEARMAFIEAMAKARSEFKPIIKKNPGYQSRYFYETLPDVIDAVDDALRNNGFNYSWQTANKDNGEIIVTCIVTHRNGHEQQNRLAGFSSDAAADKANMSGIQRAGAVVTYLQRYTLRAALGIAAENDTDGRADPAKTMSITADQFRELSDLIERAGAQEDKLLLFVGATSLEGLSVAQYAKAKDALVRKINKTAQGGQS